MHKKLSPLKHVTPILKKYNCQRQAKNGNSVKFLAPAKQNEQEWESSAPTNVRELVAGMDSLDAALRKAEKCMSGSRDTSEFISEQSVDHIADDTCEQLQDVEEDGIPSTLHGSNHQTTSNSRTPHLRNRSRMLKKRNRLQKDLEHALPLVLHDHPFASEDQSHGYALAYYNKVKEAVEESLFSEFMSVVARFGDNLYSVTDLYHRVIEILNDKPDLCEEFLGFLLPHQALHCGKFMEHLGIMEMTSFLRRLEIHFSKQPHQLRKIYASFTRLAESPDLTLETVRSIILPLLKGNNFLIDCFLALLPCEKPPESKMTDFDHFIYEEMESEMSGDEEAFERIEIPPESDDFYGGEHCRCCCHEVPSDSHSVSTPSHSKHCVPCGLKFISGKVFMQTEHGLRPVRIHFSGGGSNSANVKRLNSNPRKLSRSRSRRGRTSTSQVGLKTDDSKTQETDDEVVFSNKSKSPRSQRPKISKQGRVKSAKSLSLTRNISSRKPNCSKGGLSPLHTPHDQEALPAHDPSEDEKPANFINFISTSSNSICVDKDKQETEVKSLASDQKILEESNKNVVEPKTEDDQNIISADGFMGHAKEDCDDDLVADVDVDVSGESSEADLEDSSESNDGNSWTREEDRIILQTFQAESDAEKSLSKISSLLHNRSRDEISDRFQTLISLIQQMR